MWLAYLNVKLLQYDILIKIEYMLNSIWMTPADSLVNCMREDMPPYSLDGTIPKAILISAIQQYLQYCRSHLTCPCFFGFAVGQVNTALQLGPEEFKEKYGGEMPQQTDNVVFSCLAGIRSKAALNTAATLGYKE